MNQGTLNRLAILATLNKAPMHGYALHEQLKDEGFTAATTGGLYRVLRTMAEEDLVKSFWETPEYGPARRVYEINPSGRDYLVSERKTLHEDILQAKWLLDQIPRS